MPADFVPMAFSTDGLVPLALAMIAFYFLLTGLRRRQRKMSQPEPPKAPQRTPPPPKSEHDHLRQDLQELTAELQDLARKISADIDTRFAKLESAMRDADRRIATLHRLNRKPLSKSAAPARPAGEQQGGSNDARHNIVYELADAGFTPMEIARDLGKTTGEIELILNLRPKTPKRTQEG